jgi:hypothetical protein
MIQLRILLCYSANNLFGRPSYVRLKAIAVGAFMRTTFIVLISVLSFSFNAIADDLVDMPLPEIMELDAASQSSSDREPASVDAATPVSIKPAAEVSAKDRKDMVIRTITKNFPELKYCYKQGLKGNAKMEGKVVMGWDLDPQGKVKAAVVDNSQLKNKSVEECMLKKFSEWTFPAQAKIQNSQGRMSYTFHFTPESAR